MVLPSLISRYARDVEDSHVSLTIDDVSSYIRLAIAGVQQAGCVEEDFLSRRLRRSSSLALGSRPNLIQTS